MDATLLYKPCCIPMAAQSQYLAHRNTDFVKRGAIDGPLPYQQAVILSTMKMHSVFINTGVAMETVSYTHLTLPTKRIV